jgi:hypothetical protein
VSFAKFCDFVVGLLLVVWGVDKIGEEKDWFTARFRLGASLKPATTPHVAFSFRLR